MVTDLSLSIVDQPLYLVFFFFFGLVMRLRSEGEGSHAQQKPRNSDTMLLPRASDSSKLKRKYAKCQKLNRESSYRSKTPETW